MIEDIAAIKRRLYSEYLSAVSQQAIGAIISQMAAYGLTADALPVMLEQIGIDVADALNSNTKRADQVLSARASNLRVKFE